MADTKINVIPFNKHVIKSFEAIGGKNFIKQSIKNLDVDRKIVLIYSDKKSIQFHTRATPFIEKVGFILGSKKSLIDTYALFYFTMYDRGIDLTPTEENVKIFIKSIISHEVGHILDDSLFDDTLTHIESIVNIGNYIKSLGFDASNLLRLDTIDRDENLNDKILSFKKLMVDRETKAWFIAKQIITFNNSHEEVIFNLTKEFALATYNTIDLDAVSSMYNQLKPFHKLFDKLFEYN